MHKKYIQEAAARTEELFATDAKSIENILKRSSTRHEKQAAREIVYHVADILRFMGLRRWSEDVHTSQASLWAYVSSKEDIEAFNKVLWSFGFKHTDTKESGLDIHITFDLDGFELSITYCFTDSADCRLVKVGTKEIDVFERRCGDDDELAEVIDIKSIATGEEEDEAA